MCFVDFYVFVLDKNHVRAVKIIEDCILVGNVQEIIPKDHLRVLQNGPKIVGMVVPGRPQTMEQSTACRGSDDPSKGVIDEDLNIGCKVRFSCNYRQ